MRGAVGVTAGRGVSLLLSIAGVIAGVGNAVGAMAVVPHPASATATPMPSQNIRRILAKLFPFIGSPPH